MYCLICGKKLGFNVGRPKVYCSSSCREYSKYKNAIEAIFLKLEADKEHISIIRGDMFRLANILSNGTKRD